MRIEQWHQRFNLDTPAVKALEKVVEVLPPNRRFRISVPHPCKFVWSEIF
jgi:hypothetical protein